MTDLFWPSALEPGESDFQLVDFSARFVGPVTGSSRTYSRPGGQLVRASLTLPTLVGQRKAVLQSLVAGLRGAVNRVWLFDHSYVKRGSFPATNVFPATTATTGWSCSADYDLTAYDGRIRVTRTAYDGSNNYILRAQPAVTVTNGAPYVARFLAVRGYGSLPGGLVVQSATSASEWGSVSTSFGMVSGSHVTAATSYDVGLLDKTTTTGPPAVGEFVEIHYASLSRCALIAGASQTGTGLHLRGLPASTAGLLLYGDQVQIGNELLFVTSSLDSDAAGLGYLQVHRPLRTVPADNDPVIIHQPMGKFLLQERENGWTNRAPQTADSTLVFIEATD